MVINKKNVLVLVSYLFLNLLCFLFYSVAKYRYQILDILNGISIFQLCIAVWGLKKMGYNMWSLPIIFIILSYVFNLGQLPLIVFDINIDMPWPVYVLLGEDTYIKCIEYVIKIHFFVIFGMMVASLFKRKEIEMEKVYINENAELKRMSFLGYVFLIVGIIPVFTYEFKKLVLVSDMGYGKTGLEMSVILKIITNIFYMGIILILISVKDDEKKSFKTMLWLGIMLCLLMISGGRGEKVVRIIMLLCVYFTVCKRNKINFINYIKYGLFAYLGISFISFLRYARSDALIENISFLKICNFIVKNNPIFEILAEFGGTLITLGYTINSFIEYDLFLKGASYYKSFFMIFPNIGGFIDAIRSELMFVYKLPYRYQYALGGSYIGELYANFGNYALVFAIFIGMGLVCINNSMLKCVKEKRWINYSILILVYGQMIWWIRGYFSSIIREVVWTSLIVFISNEVVKKIERRI